MSETTRSDAPSPHEHPWTERLDTLLRWRRFLLLGIGAAWLVLLAGAVILPRTYIAEATVALPNIATSEPKGGPPVNALDELKLLLTREGKVLAAADRGPKPGIPIGTYKKVEAALIDEKVLAEAFRGKLDAKATDRVRRDVRRIVSPVTTGVRDELVRAEREDTITAVRLAFADPSATVASAVVDTLASLVREALATRLARDKAEAAQLQAASAAASALTRKLELAAKNESLKTLASDLQRLSATTPGAGTGGREVVDLADGGHRYLPAAVQLLGARAWQADNDHEIRQADWTFRVESMRVAFYRRLANRLSGGGTQADLSVVDDVPAVIQTELKGFLATQAGTAADYLRADVEGMCDVVQAHRVATGFVQQPSLRTAGRAPWVVAGMLAAAVVVLLAALIGESWRRYHRMASARA